MKKIHLIFSDSFYNTNYIEIISKEFNLSVILIGDVFRRILKSETVLGVKAQKYIDSGELVPNKLVHEIIQNEIFNTKGDILISGYPKTNEQLIFFKEVSEIQKIWYLSFKAIDIEIEKEFKSISKIKVDKYDITKELIKERMERKISLNKKMIDLLKNDFEITKIEISTTSNYLKLFKEDVKSII